MVVKALVVALAFCTVLGSQIVSAQAPSDSIRVDSAAIDSTPRYVHHPFMLPAMAVGLAILALAPSAGVLLAAPVDTSIELTWLLRDHAAVRVAAGRSAERGQTWTYSADLEILRGSWYGEARLENFHIPRHFQYQSVGGGYLFRTKRGIAAGPLVGYRRAPRDRRQSGLYLGLPYLIDLGGGVIRLEATYVFSSGGPTWNYRFLAEYPIGKGPYSFGLAVDSKSLPLDESDEEAFTSSIGLHLVRRI
jgi:hypothetical protein